MIQYKILLLLLPKHGCWKTPAYLFLTFLCAIFSTKAWHCLKMSYPGLWKVLRKSMKCCVTWSRSAPGCRLSEELWLTDVFGAPASAWEQERDVMCANSMSRDLKFWNFWNALFSVAKFRKCYCIIPRKDSNLLMLHFTAYFFHFFQNELYSHPGLIICYFQKIKENVWLSLL